MTGNQTVTLLHLTFFFFFFDYIYEKIPTCNEVRNQELLQDLYNNFFVKNIKMVKIFFFKTFDSNTFDTKLI